MGQGAQQSRQQSTGKSRKALWRGCELGMSGGQRGNSVSWGLQDAQWRKVGGYEWC